MKNIIDFTSNRLLLEEFFGVEFEFEPDCPSEKEAHFFDGAMFWKLWFDEEKRLLFFFADTQEQQQAFPTLEVGIYYEKLKAGPLTGGGDALLITSQHGSPALVITKTMQGRFSLATSLGVPPQPS